MKIKTFHAATVTEALRTIKEELGPDAVILSTKSVKEPGGVLGLFGRDVVEVTAAIDFDAGSSSSARRDAPAPPAKTQPTYHHPAFQDALRLSLRRSDDGRDRLSVSPTAREASRAAESRVPEAATAAAPVQTVAREQSPPEVARLAEEVRGLRQLVEATLQPRKVGRRPLLKRLPPTLGSFHHDLVRSGMEAEAAEQLLADIAPTLTAGQDASEAAVRHAIHRALSNAVAVAGPLLNGTEQKKTVIFVGPTGVGKTTTIAKLAAHYTLREQRSVSLITLDTYRVAAVEQLRMYAKVIGVTMDVALTKRDALDFIRRRSRSELILIDTAGRSPLDEAGLQDLRDLVSLDHPLETHLVLSATTREQDVIGGVAGYAGIPITRLLFTKLDETRAYGSLFGIAKRSGLPLSYLSTGQNVPEDLETARPERIADLVLGLSLKGDRRAALCGESSLHHVREADGESGER